MKQSLWVSNALELNDPFDSKPHQFLHTQDDGLKAAYIAKIKRMGVLSFTGKLRNNADDLLLWSHYADGHRGFCLVIRDQALYARTRKVNYLAEYPNLDTVQPGDPDFWDKVGMFKAQQWHYENECRALFDNEPDRLIRLPQQAFFAVIFWCWSTTREERQRIARAVLPHNPQCLFFQARVVPREFRVYYDYVTPDYRPISDRCQQG